MAYVPLAHVATTDQATAALHNQLLDDVAIIKTQIDDNGILNYGAPRVVSTNIGLTATDKVVLCTGTITVSLLAQTLGTPYMGLFVFVKNKGVGVVTVNVSGGAINIDGVTSVTLNTMDGMLFYSDGTQWWVLTRT